MLKGWSKFIWNGTRFGLYALLLVFIINITVDANPKFAIFIGLLFLALTLFTLIVSLAHVGMFNQKKFALFAVVISSAFLGFIVSLVYFMLVLRKMLIEAGLAS